MFTFKAKHNKSYNAEQDAIHMQNFEEKVVQINAHNEKYNRGEVTWVMGVNHMTDLTEEELKRYRGIPARPQPTNQ